MLAASPSPAPPVLMSADLYRAASAKIQRIAGKHISVGTRSMVVSSAIRSPVGDWWHIKCEIPRIGEALRTAQRWGPALVGLTGTRPVNTRSLL